MRTCFKERVRKGDKTQITCFVCSKYRNNYGSRWDKTHNQIPVNDRGKTVPHNPPTPKKKIIKINGGKSQQFGACISQESAKQQPSAAETWPTLVKYLSIRRNDFIEWDTQKTQTLWDHRGSRHSLLRKETCGCSIKTIYRSIITAQLDHICHGRKSRPTLFCQNPNLQPGDCYWAV